MVDIPEKIETNLESKKLNIDENIDKEFIDITENTESVVDTNSMENLEITDNNIDSSNEKESTETVDSSVANCLALTVKKDYSLSIAKNVVLKTFKNVWRIALSIFTLNFLKFFL